MAIIMKSFSLSQPIPNLGGGGGGPPCQVLDQVHLAESCKGRARLHLVDYQRRYEIINIPCDLCAHQCVSSWGVPHTVAELKLKNCGIPSLNSVVLITDHSHIHFIQGSRGITLENRH